MSRAFTKESDDLEDEDLPEPDNLPAGARNYITPEGHARLKRELDELVATTRPDIVRTLASSTSAGETANSNDMNAKRRLREIDRRIRFLIKRLEKAEIVDPGLAHTNQVFFGANVTVRDQDGEQNYTIVGVDEVDLARGYVSWVSPIAKALLRSRTGDVVRLDTPAGVRELEVCEVKYLHSS